MVVKYHSEKENSQKQLHITSYNLFPFSYKLPCHKTFQPCTCETRHPKGLHRQRQISHRHGQFAKQRSPADLWPCHNCWLFPKVGGDSSIGGVSDWKARCNTDMGLSPLDQWRIFHPESTSSADSLTTSIQPLCATACINIRAHVKNPKHWQPYHCLDTWKYYTHWQEWVALLLRLLCRTQVQWPEFPARDKEVLPKKYNKKLLLSDTLEILKNLKNKVAANQDYLTHFAETVMAGLYALLQKWWHHYSCQCHYHSLIIQAPHAVLPLKLVGLSQQRVEGFANPLPVGRNGGHSEGSNILHTHTQRERHTHTHTHTQPHVVKILESVV